MVGHFVKGEDASSYIKEKKMSDAYPGSFVQLKSDGQSSSPIPE